MANNSTKKMLLNLFCLFAIINIAMCCSGRGKKIPHHDRTTTSTVRNTIIPTTTISTTTIPDDTTTEATTTEATTTEATTTEATTTEATTTEDTTTPTTPTTTSSPTTTTTTATTITSKPTRTTKTTPTRSPVHVYSGEVARRKQFPWHAHLTIHYRDKETKCSGALITKRWVLTTAQPFTRNTTVVNVDVRMGSFAHATAAEKWIVHEVSKKSRKSYVGDLALVKLPHQFSDMAKIPSFHPINIAIKDVPKNYHSVVLSDFRGASYTSGLKSIRLYRQPCKSENYYICAALSKYTGVRKGICPADPGAPIVVYPDYEDPVLVGIASTGANCKEEGGFNKFTKVAYYFHWILKYAY